VCPSGKLLLLPIAAPFPHVAVHIVQAPRIGALLTNLVTAATRNQCRWIREEELRHRLYLSGVDPDERPRDAGAQDGLRALPVPDASAAFRFRRQPRDHRSGLARRSPSDPDHSGFAKGGRPAGALRSVRGNAAAWHAPPEVAIARPQMSDHLAPSRGISNGRV